MSPMQVKNLQKRFNRDSVTTDLEGYTSLNEKDQAMIAAMLPAAESDGVYSTISDREVNVNPPDGGSPLSETNMQAHLVTSDSFYCHEWGIASGGGESDLVISWLRESTEGVDNPGRVNNAQSLEVARAELVAAEAEMKVVELRVDLAKAKIDAIQKRVIAESIGRER
ncbi:hypothetical protein FRB98_008576 [Tulasnella sp. 332]|nr:hypothetical protein FRB98_008576 [Tulasnella sp. 332]